MTHEIVSELVLRLDGNLRENYEERAAIMEFDGGLSRDHAECLALLDVVRRHPMALTGVSLSRMGGQYVLTSTGEVADLSSVINVEFGGRAGLTKL